MNALKKSFVFLLVFLVLGVSNSSFAQSVRVKETDQMLRVLRQKVQKQYEIPSHDVFLLWNDVELEEKLKKFGPGAFLEVNDADLGNAAKRKSFSFKVMSGDTYKGRIPVRLNIDGWVDVYKAISPIPKDQVLPLSAIEATRIKISELPFQYFRSPFRIEDYVALRDIPQGEVLQPSMVRERLMMKSGEEVKVILINESIRLVTKGEAMASASRNQTVRVKILIGNNKIVQAQVTGDHEVTVRVN